MKAPLLVSLGCAIVAFAIGYFVADNSAEINKLQSELAQARRASLSVANSRERSAGRVPVEPPADAAPKPAELERPSQAEWQTQAQQRALANWVARAAAERSDEYTKLFSELGLTPEDTERFKAKLTELHQKAIEAGEPMAKLVEARGKYDEELQMALGEANYLRYRNHESLQPARREYALLREYAEKQNVALDQTQEDAILRLIKDTEVETTETWQGPYDPTPRPGYGRQQVSEQMTKKIKDITQRSRLMLESASQAGIPIASVKLLENYYAEKIREMSQELADVNRPPEERAGEIRAHVERLRRGFQEKENAH